MTILDHYFKHPVKYDYLLGISLSFCAFRLHRAGLLGVPKDEYLMSMASDLTTIALTLAGFILTLLTVLITFKSTSTVSRHNYTGEEPLFDLFFASGLYFTTVMHLKNCVKSLTFITIVGYSLKLLLPGQYHIYIFLFNIVGLAILSLTIWRSLLILTKVLNMQQNAHNEEANTDD
jgi:hypothetical protein